MQRLAVNPDQNISQLASSMDSLSEEEMMPIAWLFLTKRLADLVTDSRHEVRNGAVHTALRIFDNYGDELSPQIWQLCLESILFPMVSKDIATYSDLEPGGDNDTDFIETVKAKIGTSQIVLQGMSKLVADHLETISSSARFGTSWILLTGSFSKYLEFQLHDLTASVFSSIGQVLSKDTTTDKLDQSAVRSVCNIWDNQFPSAKSRLPSSNTEAFEAYITSLKSLYPFRKKNITVEETATIIANLERCVREADSPSYSSDLDSLTALHSQIISCVALLRSNTELSTVPILAMLSRFLELPFEAASREKKTGLTFISLSKASMGLIESFTGDDASWTDIFDSDVLQTILANLERTIQLKYKWARQGRSPPLWRKATTTALSVIEHSIPKMFALHAAPAKIQASFTTIVRISAGISHADLSSSSSTAADVPPSTIAADESFDMAAHRALHAHAIPALGSPLLSDPTRRAYARALLTASLIHDEPDPEELDLDDSPLRDLYAARFGRTLDPPPSPRSAMAYRCLDALLGLVRASDGSPARVKLARAAAPYAILRAALPLRAYVADQPLRGAAMPAPESQRRELVHVLRGLGGMRCEPAAIPATDGFANREAGQLARLLPLVVRAAAVEGGPVEVRRELGRWMERLGGAMGLPVELDA
jgi:hypothetical protein